MVYDKAIIKLLLQRVRAEFCKGTRPKDALEFMRVMAENNKSANYIADASSQKNKR